MKASIFSAICIALSFGGIAVGQTAFERQFQHFHKAPVAGKVDEFDIVEKFIDQKVDNNDDGNTDTWKMRYLSTSRFHQEGGPIFIIIGGEWEITAALLGNGHVFDMAKELNAHLFATEHRYYGSSTPTRNLTIDSLQYLTVPQVLADLVNFINQVKVENENLKDSKVFLFGSGYSASLATWLKRENPNLVAGVWASSALISAKVDFEEYRESVGESIAKTGGKQCFDHIQSGLRNLKEMLEKNNIAEVKAMLKICDNFNGKDELDVQWLLTALSNEFSILVENHRNNSTREACREILSETDPTIATAKWLLRQQQTTAKCNDFTYRSILDSVGNTQFNNKITGEERKWTYQTCNEFGWFPTTSSEHQIFGRTSPLEFYVTICQDAFGDSFTKERIINGALLTNFRYHGSLHGAENVYMTYGALDPWKFVGSHGPIVSMTNESHFGHLESTSASDSNELRAAKEGVLEAIKQWL